MKFNKYTSTENSYRLKYIAILHQYGYVNVPWVASEKIDGANFSFISDGKTVAVASRNQLVNGGFYNCQEVIDRYSDKVLYLKQIHFSDAKQIQIYGELYGQGIQGKVNYGPGKEYMAFEIQVDGVVVDTDKAAGLLTLVGIPTAPSFGVWASLDEALELSNEFKSVVYPDAPDENVAEGLVLKPVKAVYLGCGGRVILKNKNPAFAEKKKKKKTSTPNPWIDIADQYVTQNRLDAVLSKEGEIKPSDFGRVIRLMSNDVIDAMIKDDDLPEDWRKDDNCKLAGKGITTAVAAFLKVNLLHKL